MVLSILSFLVMQKTVSLWIDNQYFEKEHLKFKVKSTSNIRRCF